jgi:hypothetical protein
VTIPGEGGQQPAPQNAPPPGLLFPGVQPGSLPGVFVGRLVIIFGTATPQGMFVYRGSPALGDLADSITASAADDAYGNPYAADISAYGPSQTSNIIRGPSSSLLQSVDTGTATWAVNPAAGSTVLMTIWAADSETISSVVDNGSTPTTFTLDATHDANGQSAYIYRANNITLPASGSYVVTVTAANGHSINGGGVAYYNVKPGAPTATNFGTSAASNSPATGNVTPAGAGALYAAVFCDASAAETITLTGAGFNQTFINDTNNTFRFGASADKIDSAGPTATQCTWSLTDSVAWTAVIAVYESAATFGYPYVNIGNLNGVPFLAFNPLPPATSFLKSEPGMNAEIQTFGSSEYSTLFMISGKGPAGDQVLVALLSGSADGTSLGAEGILQYQAPSGAIYQPFTWTAQGINGTGRVYAQLPGATVPTSESFHTPTTTGFAANAGSQPVQYALTNDGLGIVMVCGIMVASGAYVSGTTIWTMPSGYVPQTNIAYVSFTRFSGGGFVAGGYAEIASTGAVSIAENIGVGDVIQFSGVYRLSA